MGGTPAGVFVRGMVATTTSLAAAALSHVGWWLEWQTRTSAGQGSRPLDDSEPA